MYLFAIVLSLFIFPLVSAQANETGYDLGYQCLNDLIDDKGLGALTSEELSFSLLALSHDSNRQTELGDALKAAGSDGCWPSGSCTLKDTSLALLALNQINEDTNSAENWLKNKTQPADDLVWFLQIDSSQQTQCDLKYKDIERSITVNDDKTISGSAGSCFRSAFGGFWLEIDEDCYDTEFEISCDQDFVTSVAYRKKLTAGQDAPFYISSITHTAPSAGTTKEIVNSLCFTKGGCDYEGSLWASLALAKTGSDVNPYLPYLTALSSDNGRFLPSAFLYMLTGFDEYFSELVNEQSSSGFWQSSSNQDDRFQDTALALLALQSTTSEQARLAEEYLLEVQPDNGCWRNSLSDTAFILHSANPKPIAKTVSVSSRSDCEDFGFSCTQSIECGELGGENKGDNFYCPFTSDICCSVSPTIESCSEKGGSVCGSLQECSGTYSPASDTSFCCLGTCTEIETNECEDRGYGCQSFCDPETEEEKPYRCGEGIQSCCSAKAQETAGGGFGFVIVLLVILIILLALAIIFRNQVKIWVFRTKSKFKKGPAPGQRRPPSQGPPRPAPSGFVTGRPVGRPAPRPRPRPGLRPGPRPGPQPLHARRGLGRRPYPKEQELQGTLKKLREMGRK